MMGPNPYHAHSWVHQSLPGRTQAGRAVWAPEAYRPSIIWPMDAQQSWPRVGLCSSILSAALLEHPSGASLASASREPSSGTLLIAPRLFSFLGGNIRYL